MKRILKMEEILKDIENIDKTDIQSLLNLSEKLRGFYYNEAASLPIKGITEGFIDSIKDIVEELVYDLKHKTTTDLKEEYDTFWHYTDDFKNILKCLKSLKK